MTQFALLFFFHDPNLPYLPLANFSPVFEVFMGIGFAFFVLTKVDDFLNSMLGVEARPDMSITATIDINIELANKLINQAREKRELDIAMDISEHEAKLNDLKGEIEQERFRIIYNARYYFLLLGFHALTLLIFCGLEHYCINVYPDRCKSSFYGALLTANLYFLSTNFLLTWFVFQHNRNETILWKVLFCLMVLIVFIITGAWVQIDILTSEILIVFSIVSLGVPFVLLLNRHARYKYVLRNRAFENTVSEVYKKLLRIKIRLSDSNQ